MKRILVFVVRHGEREDEVYDDADNNNNRSSSYRKRGREDRVDPKMTVRGHQQATYAFEKLLLALRSANVKKVTVFTSPLKRAVGTAMMIGSASQKKTTSNDNGYSVIRFVLPDPDATKDNSVEQQQHCIIPVVVYNGLSDCTALVARLGGHENLVRSGLMSCAATPNNTINHVNNTVHTRIKEIQKRAIESYRFDIEVKEKKADKGRNDCKRSPSELSSSVQFWKIENDQDGESYFVPMTQSISLENKEENDNALRERDDSITKKILFHTDDYTESQDKSPIDQVVRMAIHAGCEACIVSSHREEIRELYKHRCNFRHHRIDLSYCCIGKFEVIVDEDDNASFYWILHGVDAYQDLDKDSISVMLSPDPTKQLQIQNSFPVTYPVIERTTLVLCEAELILDELASEKSVIAVRNCSITGIHPASKDCTLVNSDNDGIFSLNLCIVKGHHSWLEFLHRAQDDVAHGTLDLRFDSEDSSPMKRQFRVRPDQQPTLPCPPKQIVIEVIN